MIWFVHIRFWYIILVYLNFFFLHKHNSRCLDAWNIPAYSQACGCWRLACLYLPSVWTCGVLSRVFGGSIKTRWSVSHIQCVKSVVHVKLRTKQNTTDTNWQYTENGGGARSLTINLLNLLPKFYVDLTPRNSGCYFTFIIL